MANESSFDSQELCEECMQPATCQCVKCECHLCDDCFDKVHKQFKWTRSHVKEPLSQQARSVVQMCREHKDRPVEYFCNDDSCAVCAHCVIVGAHRGHNISTVEQQKDALKAVVADAQRMLSSCQKSELLLKKMQQQAKLSELTSLSAIEAHFEEMIAAFIQRKELLIAQTSKAFSVHSTLLKQLLIQIEKNQKYLQSFANVDSDPITMIQLAKDFDRQLPCVVSDDQQPFTVRFQFDHKGLVESFSNYGQLCFPTSSNVTIEKFDAEEVVVSSEPALRNSQVKPMTGLENDSSHFQYTSSVVKLPLESSPGVHHTSSALKPPLKSNKDFHDTSSALKPPLKSNADVYHTSSALKPPLKSNTDIHHTSSALKPPLKSNADFHDTSSALKPPLKSNTDSYDTSSGFNPLLESSINVHTSSAIKPSTGCFEINKKNSSSSFSGAMPPNGVFKHEERFEVHPDFPTPEGVFRINGLPVLSSRVPPGLPSIKDVEKQLANTMDAKKTLMEAVMLNKPGIPAESKTPSFASASSTSAITQPAFSSPSSASGSHTSSTSSGSWEKVYLVNIRNPGHFTVQYEKDIPKLNNLMEEINAECLKSQSILPLKHIYKGSPVLARFTDKEWCRAEVLRTVDDKVEVYFIDYGNTECVSRDAIQEIPSKMNFFKHPKMSSLCALDGIEPSAGEHSKWSETVVKAFARMSNNVMMLMKIKRQTDEKMYVELAWLPLAEDVIRECRLELVSDALVFKGLAMRTAPAVKKSRTSAYCEANLPRRGHQIKAIVSHCKEPSFAVQLQLNDLSGSGTSLLEVLSTDLHSIYGSEENRRKYQLRVPAKGMPVAAHSCTGLWYRAYVTEPSASQVKVVFVDYGNEEVLPIDEICKLCVRFLSSPIQAISCKLDSESPASYKTVNRLFHTAETFDLTVSEVLPGPVLVVSISAESRTELANGSPAAYRVSTPKITPTHTLEAETSPVNRLDQVKSRKILTPVQDLFNYKPAYISHVVSPGEIYFQMVSKEDKLKREKLMSELNEFYDSVQCVPGKKWVKGENCVVCRYQDLKWYRASIDEVSPDNNMVKVHVGDYGYREWTQQSELRVLENRFVMPWFAAQCHLAGIAPLSLDGVWSELACETIFSMLNGKKVFMERKGDRVKGSFPVDLLQKEVVRGGALSPDREVGVSVAVALVNSEMARFLPQSADNNAPESSQSRSSTPQSSASSSAEKSPMPLSSSSSNGAARQLLSSQDFAPPIPPSSSVIEATVTHVNDLGLIFVQDISAESKAVIKDLHDHYQRTYRDTKPVQGVTWKVGCPVAAQFQEDRLFYRAKVVGFTDAGIEVLFVDYGNIEVMQKESLRLLSEEFVSQPIGCFSCCLHDLVPVQSDCWDEGFVSAVTRLTEGKPCSIEIKETDENGVLAVDIVLPDKRNISDLLFRKGLARRASELVLGLGDSSLLVPCDSTVVQAAVGAWPLVPERMVASPYPPRLLPKNGDYIAVTVPQIDSLNVVYIQYAIKPGATDPVQRAINEELEQLKELNKTFMDMSSSYPPLAKESTHPGAACLAQFSDGFWYRGEIIDIIYAGGDNLTDQIGVRFVDYGSFEFISADRLRELPGKHLSLPVQAIRCNLAGIRQPQNEELLNEAYKKLSSLLLNRALIAVVRDSSYFDSELTVDLYDREDFEKCGSKISLIYNECIATGLLELTFDSSTASAANSFCSQSGSDDDDE